MPTLFKPIKRDHAHSKPNTVRTASISAAPGWRMGRSNRACCKHPSDVLLATMSTPYKAKSSGRPKETTLIPNQTLNGGAGLGLGAAQSILKFTTVERIEPTRRVKVPHELQHEARRFNWETKQRAPLDLPELHGLAGAMA